MTTLTDFPTVKKYLERIGAEQRSLLSAIVKQKTGDRYWIDIAKIVFTKQGEVIAPEGYVPTKNGPEQIKPNDDEAQRIKIELSGHQWPQPVFIPSENDPALPDRVKTAEDVYWFRDPNGNIVMAQVRGVDKKGSKTFWPLTKWDDGEYRWAEPDGLLPLYGLERIKESTTVFIHEGAKGAILCNKIATGEIDHPWAQELSNAVHLAWIGGALNPSRTDWNVLQKHGVTRAYLVADNDAPGMAAVPPIARHLNCVTMAVQFTDQWPRGFDLGDEFPKSMFKSIAGNRYYIGPAFRECVEPATYMTNIITVIDDKGKPKNVPVLRHHAKGQWIYLDGLELFVNSEAPNIVRKKDALDMQLCNFSDSRRTSELILQTYNGRNPTLVYRPDLPGRRVISNGEVGINTYIPPSIKPEAGDIAPFLEFMKYLVPVEEERRQILRWVATVVARPDIRPMFGILAISEQTGTGKSTLGEKILAPLVGMHNTTFPSEQQITDSTFNSWLKGRRLAVVNEIYAGHSVKAANKLKSIITDRFVEINEKFLPILTMDNFISIYACSNSLKALRLDSTDRRWFIPQITEERWPKDRFDEFFAWLASGGLNIIAHWAHHFSDYLHVGEIAPMSSRKQEMIDSGMSEALQYAESIAIAISRSGEPTSVGYVQIREWLKARCGGKIYDSDQEIQRCLKNAGLSVSKKRRYAAGHNQKIVMNVHALDKVRGLDEKEALDMAVKFIRMPGEIMNNGEM